MKRPHLPGLLAALALAAVAAWPVLAAPGLINTRAGGDSPFLLLRLYELQANLQAGVLPARWMPDAAFGLGYPFFNYYASLPYYLGATLSLAGAGVLWAIKLTHLSGFLAAAAAMYALVDALTDDPAAALLAAAAYTFAPFHMVNVYVRGDSLSEFYAFIFYPLILWAIVRLRRAPTAGNLALLALAYAGLMLTHNISALIFTPLAGLALLGAVLSAPRNRLRVLFAGSLAFLLGAALSVWFWVPALRERGAVSLQEMTTGYFNYSGHFRDQNLVQPALLFDYRIDFQHTPFVMGGLQAALAVLGLVLLLASWLWQRRPHWVDLALVLLLAYAVWPITSSSAIVWERLPLLPMIQFPWRFLSITALVTALIAGLALGRLGRARAWLAPLLCAALAVSALALLRPEIMPLRTADVTPERLQLYEQLTGNIGSTVRAEYLPAQAVPRPFSGASLINGEPHPLPIASEGSLGEARLLSAGPTRQSWAVTVTSVEARLVFQTYAFPGWQATIDGQPAPIDSTIANGRIALPIKEGQHRVELSLGSTPLRATAEKVSLGAALPILALLVFAGWRSRYHWRRFAVAGAVVACLAGSAALAGALSALAQAPALATETMDFIQQPYLHPNPQGVAYGSTARLTGYELSAREAGVGDELRVRLHWQAANPVGLRAIVRLTTAAGALFDAPDLQTSEAPLGPVTEHTLTVPAEVAPGLAFLAVELRGPEGLIGPQSSGGTALGTTYLAPIRVHPPAPAPDAPAQARLGKSLDLLQATASQPRPGVLRLFLTWRPKAPLPEDYVTSIRLVGPDGQQVPDAGRDVQPRYGLYPTSLWRVGCPVADYYEFAIPPGTAPGPGYQVEVTLYQARTLAPLCSVRIPDITLTQPTVDAKTPVLQAFAGGLALTQWKPGQLEVDDGDSLSARLQWTAQATPLADAAVRLSLRDGQDRAVAAGEAPLSPSYPPSRWPLHALINTSLSLHIPPGTPTGRYRLALEAVSPDGRSLGRWDPPEEVTVRTAQRRTEVPTFAHPAGVDFGGLIRLPGYDLERSAGQLAITFHWQALQAPGKNYKVFLHCFNPANQQMAAQRDAIPLGDTYPTSRWAAGEVVSDRLVLDMQGVPAGRYQLAVGWYDPATGERLEPAGGNTTISDRRVLLTEIEWP